MKKIILASLMAIAMVASASAVDVKPYFGIFPVRYTSVTEEYPGGGDGPDITSLSLGFGAFSLGMKISDFRMDIMLATGYPSFNVYYDFNVSDSFLPYLKAGFAYQRKVKDYGPVELKSVDKIFAIGCGIGYQVANHLILDAGIDYIYAKNKEKTIGSPTSKSTDKGFGVNLGARLQF